MNTIWKLTLSQLRMYMRDRQSVFFALFFPIAFMLALGFMGGGDVKPLEVSVVSESTSTTTLIAALDENSLLNVHRESDAAAREFLTEGDRDAVIITPTEGAEAVASSTPVTVLLNSSEPQKAAQTLAVIESVLLDVERGVRNTTPLYTLVTEDIQLKNVRYIDFLIPGLVAMMIMQLSIAGSGFNIVEYKRKGILKRLFVTPLRPYQFILALIFSRLLIVIVQMTVLLVVAKLAFDITIVGSVALLYVYMALGSLLFLALGFALGGIAKTQNAAMMVGNLFIFPQMFLAGVFFSLDSLPSWVRPGAQLMPLNFVSDSLRQIANKGAVMTDLGLNTLGIVIWFAISLALAVYFFRWSDAANS